MSSILLTKNTTFLIGPVTQFMGFIMNGIYMFLSIFNIENIALCIILFTIIAYLLMTPLTIKQQKFTKLQAKMNPEIQKIQAKYKDKKDQDSMMRMNEETKLIYEKYGVSPTGSCLQLLIQMPIILALYQVIHNIPAYVTGVKDVFIGGSNSLVNGILDNSKALTYLEELVGSTSTLTVNIPETGFTADKLVDVLYKFNPENWTGLAEFFQGIGESDMVSKVGVAASEIARMSNFFGINISDSPWNIIKDSFASGAYLTVVGAALIPILAGLTQFISVKLMPQAENANSGNEEGALASSMKSMNTVMPLMSVFFCMTFSVGIGIYWIAGSVIRTVQQVLITRHFNKVDMDDLVKKNMEKINRKREKKGLPPQSVSSVARVNTKNISEPRKNVPTREDRAKAIKDSTQYYSKDAKPGSLASKANMVAKFNDKNKK